MRIPDYLEPITGYRVWRVAKGGLLTGVHVCEPWVPKQAHKASCQKASIANHSFWGVPPATERVSPHLVDGVFNAAPVLTCVCGLWATKHADTGRLHIAASAPEASTQEGFAWGTVSLWGRLIEHTEGWRAEFAYPKALQATSDAPQIAALYGIPCEPITVASAPPYLPADMWYLANSSPFIYSGQPLTVRLPMRYVMPTVFDPPVLSARQRRKDEQRKRQAMKRDFLAGKYQSKAARRGFLSECHV